MIETVETEPMVKLPVAPLRLDYLDGLRGLAAFYVVMHHATDLSWAGGAVPASITTARKLFVYGHFAVAVFIILSGYCLMLPVARSADRQLRGGIGEYLRRRARRILPPYYASILVTLLFIVLTPQLRTAAGNYWDAAIPAFRSDVVLSHVLLVHNLTENWHYKIDPPLWSVATEWQIYFFFALLLLPVWRRLGMAATLAIAFVLGLAPHFLLPPANNLDVAVPWYLSLFALGMCAAVINFSRETSIIGWRERIPWGNLTAFLFVSTAVVALAKAHWWWRHLWFADIQVGLFAACLLIYITRELLHHRTNRLLQVLQARPVVLLGVMSYSLYLIHAPLLALLHVPLHQISLSPSARLGVMLFLYVPLTIPLAYLFHLAFERRFMSSHRPHTHAVVRASSDSHAG